MKHLSVPIVTLLAITLVLSGCGSSPSTATTPVVQTQPTTKPETKPQEDTSVAAADNQTTVEPESYELTVEIRPEDAGLVYPYGGTYEPGDKVNLSVITYKGYIFNGWAGSANGTDEKITLIMDSDKTVIAEFTDITKPIVFDAVVSEIRDVSANISWKTSKETTCILRYGPNTDYAQTLELADTSGNDHSVVLTGLEPGRTWYLRIIVTDSLGNRSFSDELTFRTRTIGESLFPRFTNAFLFGHSFVQMNFSLASECSQPVYLRTMRLFDENNNLKYTVDESEIRQQAPENRIAPDTEYAWSLEVDPPFLATDVSGWTLKWYFTDEDGKEFILTCPYSG